MGGASLEIIPIPDNPNAVVFSMDARPRLADRSWAELVREALVATRTLHEGCGADVLAGWSWRVALDRKNRRHTQLLLWVQFDGPSTSAHFDTLEQHVRGAFSGASAACIERVPVNGAAAVAWREGTPHFAWHPAGEHPEPWAIRLGWQDDHIAPAVILRSAAGADIVPAELAEVTLGEPVYDDDQLQDERLRLAFAMHHTDAIVRADGVVEERESAFVANLFPPDLVRSLGLDRDGSRDEYFDEAKTVLKDRLGHHDKLALVGLFFSACYSDGTLDAREMRVLKNAGEQLGLTREQVVKYLRRFW